MKEADSLLTELMTQVKVKCQLIMRSICSQGEKTGTNSFTPGDAIMHKFLSHIWLSFLLQTKRAIVGTVQKV